MAPYAASKNVSWPVVATVNVLFPSTIKTLDLSEGCEYEKTKSTPVSKMMKLLPLTIDSRTLLTALFVCIMLNTVTLISLQSLMSMKTSLHAVSCVSNNLNDVACAETMLRSVMRNDAVAF